MREWVYRIVAVLLFSLSLGAIWFRPEARPVALDAPVVICDEPNGPENFFPAAWCGTLRDGALVYAECDAFGYGYRAAEDAPSGHYGFRIHFRAKEGQLGLGWQFPAHNWGASMGYALDGVSELRLWLRGERGGETVWIRVGGVPGKHGDTAVFYSEPLVLTREWSQHRFDLSERDFSNLISGLGVFVYGGIGEAGRTIWLDAAELR